MSWRPIAQVQDPDAKQPYGLNWAPYLYELGQGVTLTASTWASTPSGLSLSDPSIVLGLVQTQVRVSGGVDGVDYTLTNHIIASDGTEDERSFVVKVRQR